MVPEIWSATGRTFCNFGRFFALLPLSKPEKSKFLKNGKKHLEILSFYTNVPEIIIICYTFPEILRVTDVIVIFHFWPFFALLSPSSLKKIKISKK